MSIDHYENFPVASVLCPPAIRPAVMAIYHCARTADDLADEGTAPPVERLADLAAFRSDLDAVAARRAPSPRWDWVFDPLAAAMQSFQLPPSHLRDLLDAFEQDVRNPPYPDRPMLLDYCRRSANPVGRLLLHLYGIADERSLAQADAICSSLQLINFWQDLSVDGPRGRCYVPEADMQAHGVTRDELARCHDSPRMRALVRALVDFAEQLMLQGAPLALRVPGRGGWELRLVVQGGLRIAEKIRRMDYAAVLQRPKLGPGDVPVLALRAWRMPKGTR